MTADLHTLTGAYALDALSEAERVEFDRHLQQCGACRQEVAELQATAARLATVVRAEPPPHLRSAVLTDISRTRQQPPRLRAHKAVRMTKAPWTGWLAAGVVAVIALVLGVRGLSADRRLDAARQEQSAVNAVLTAPDATPLTGTGQGGTSRASAIVSRSRGEAVLLAGDLPALDARHAYQVWTLGPGTVRSAGLLRGQVPHQPRPVVTGIPADANRVAITVEPAGGSPGPTTPAV
ncbi:MAG TPA: anti-sigma factor, partial [Streptomyces sp.]